MNKISLVSLLFIVSVMLIGCGMTSENEIASDTDEQTVGEEAVQEEQPTAEGNSTEEMNQTKSDIESTEKIIYENTEYGFTFYLPKSWAGYQIVMDSWEGYVPDQQQNKIVENGPIILIRHPNWTEENARQDIPIMVFTPEQWSSLNKEEFFIGAAPILPKVLGQNKTYVFALPARYNFAFPEGYEEVEDILETNPLQTTN